ncbi:MAG TPA: metallopeptidase TldD-related protein [Candidatus Nanopelagicales bacterium]|nr:metallopeptidase TldD-related protein [Candidatus Nanopelagicales bacterium]
MTTPAELVERALAASDTEGCIVLAQTTSTANLRWARNTLTTNGETEQTALTVIAVIGRGSDAAAGSVTRTGVSPDQLPELLAQAKEAAVQGGASPDAADLLTGPADATWADPPELTSGAVLAELAHGLGQLFAASVADGIEHFGFASHDVVTSYLGTSTGMRRRHVQPEGRLELTAKSHDRSRSAWSGAATADFGDIDLTTADRDLRRALDWQARRVEVPAGRHTAVLAPSAVADLMVELYWSALGREAAEGRSVFSGTAGTTRLGERLGPTGIELASDPALAGLAGAPFSMATASSSAASVFDNGLPLRPTRWVDDGVLRALVTSRATATELDLPLHPYVDNLRLEVAGGHGDLFDLAARTGTGLLVTCLWYNRVVDPHTLLLTGLTRDGVYLVEGGEIIGTTGNFRFNDSPVAMLDRITDAGVSGPTLAREMGDYFNRAAMPPLQVADFNLSTVSKAS